jgi:hypothetical protein
LFAQIFLKIFRITFKLVEKISPSVAGKWALRLFASPRRPARPEWEEEFLSAAERVRIPFRSHFSLDKRSNHYIRYSWGKKDRQCFWRTAGRGGGPKWGCLSTH